MLSQVLHLGGKQFLALSSPLLAIQCIRTTTSQTRTAKIEILKSTNEYGVAEKLAPLKVDLEEGKTYFWCSCGASKKQPFCDGAHKKLNAAQTDAGKIITPISFKCIEGGQMFMCMCKASNNRPSCDGSHKKL